MIKINEKIKHITILILKYFIFIILEVLIFFFLSRNLPGIHIENLSVAFTGVILLSLINAILWPIVSYFSLSFIIYTFGIGTFIMDGLFLGITSYFVPGFKVDGFALVTIPILFGLINSFINILLSIDTDNTYYRFVLKKEIERSQNNISSKSGFIFLEIDGLARPILDKALKRGDMPTLNRWIKESSHKLISWETDLSSQTGVSQAGILHGYNENMPAFRWVEKKNNNKIVSSNNFKDSAMLEKRISNGEGLLSCNGASRANLFSGDAVDIILTSSKFREIKSLYSKTWYYLYSSPYNFARLLLLFTWDIILELSSQIRQFLKNIRPRLSRKPSYLVARAGANVVLREVATFSIIGDIFACNYDTIYSTYMGYDEIAHHSGIEDYDAFYSLRQIDKQFQHIEKAINESKRNYYITVLSDHGQSFGPTFKQKFNITLEDLVKQNLPENITIHSVLYSNNDHFEDQLSLKHFTEEKSQQLDDKIDETKEHLIDIKDKTIDKFKEKDTAEYLINIKDKTIDKFKENEKVRRKLLYEKDKPFFERFSQILKDNGLNINLSKEELVKDNAAQTIVLASGNLGLIYFTDWNYRLSYEQIEDAFPNLLSGLINHDGIGFVLVKSDIYGSIVLSDNGIYYLDSDTYEGKNPIKCFEGHLADHLRRTTQYENVPDILVNSTYDNKSGEVYAFEELIGSHGGVGGTQTEPFILYPNNWNLNKEIVGSTNVYKFFKKQMNIIWANEKNNK